MGRKIKFGSVAWGLPGGGMYAPLVAYQAGLDGIQLELGSYAAGYPLAQKDIQKGYLLDKEKYNIEYTAIVLNDVMEHEFINGYHIKNGKIAYEQMELAVEVADELKIHAIMIPNFIKNLITTKNHIENTISALKFICEKAEKKEIMILTENALNWQKQIDLLDSVGYENLKIHFDTQNFKLNFHMDQVEQLEHLFPYMADQLHVKDGIQEPGDKLLGDGNTDFYKQMNSLMTNGFEGWIILENYYNFSPLRNDLVRESQTSSLKKDIATLKYIFNS